MRFASIAVACVALSCAVPASATTTYTGYGTMISGVLTPAHTSGDTRYRVSAAFEAPAVVQSADSFVDLTVWRLVPCSAPGGWCEADSGNQWLPVTTTYFDDRVTFDLNLDWNPCASSPADDICGWRIYQFDFRVIVDRPTSWAFTGGYLTDGVPEPTSWALMILGFGVAGVAMRRRYSSTTVRLKGISFV